MKKLLGLVFCLLCAGPWAFGQNSGGGFILQFQNAGTNVAGGTYTKYAKVNFLTGCTAAVSGGALNITCTGAAGNPGGVANQIQYNSAGTAFAGFTLGQDCTLVVATGAITCTKTNNVAFTGLATLAEVDGAIPIGATGSWTTSTAPAISAANMTNFPTFNQNTTGSAAKWTTARNLAGNSVDGSANVAFANKFVVQGTTDSGLSAAQFLGALGTGIVKNTTTTGVLSIAVAGDFPTLNQNTTGTAANVTGTVAIANGGSGQTTAGAAFNALAPATAAGGLIVGTGTNTYGNLAIGSASTCLQVNGGGTALVFASCATGTIGGSGTGNALSKFTGASTIGNALFTDNGTAGAYSGTGGFQLTGAGTFLQMLEGVAPTGVASNDLLWADSTAHRFKVLNNAGSATTLAQFSDNLSVFAATTSAQLAGVISDETGSGALVFATSPTLVTPTIGVATATSINKVAITAPTTSATLTIADGKTLAANNSITLAGTDGTTWTGPSSSATLLSTAAAVTVAQGGTGVATLAAHGLLVGEGTSNVAVTATGTANQVFQSGGALADPSWSAYTLPATVAANQALFATSATTVTAGALPNAALANSSITFGTTSPITGAATTALGGTITFACATCVVATTPGAGIAHFAGSTQTVTSSAVALGGSDVSGTLAIGNGGTGQTTAGAAFNALAPATATGGLIVGSGTNTYTNLVMGTANQCLTVNSGGTAVVWGACSTGSVTGSSLANTQVVVATGASTVTSYAGFTSDSSGNVTTASLTTAPTAGTAGKISVVGGTTAPALSASTFALLGPSSAVATAFAWQAPAAENGSAGILHVAAASSHISALSVSAINLASADVTGVTPVGNGGTGQSNLTSNNVLVGNGTSAVHLQAPVDGGIFASATAASTPVFTQTPALGDLVSTKGTITLNTGAPAGAIKLDPGATGTTWTLVLPINHGTLGQCLQSSGSDSTATSWGSCGGSPSLDQVGNLAGNKTFVDGNFTLTFQNQLTTASASAVTFTESAASTSTGTPFLVNINTLATSTLNPLVVTALGTANGVKVDTTGLLQAIGTGGIKATTLNGATFAAPGAIGGTTPGSVAATTITGTSSITLGANGGTGGSVVINGSTSGSATINASATGVLALPSGTTATSMALTTPSLGVATATTVNKVTLTTPATGSTLTVADGKTLTATNTMDVAKQAGVAGGVPWYDTTTSQSSSALLAANGVVLGGGASAAPATVAGITTDGASVLTLGVSGTSAGGIVFNNVTSGAITLNPGTGAITSYTIQLPVARPTSGNTFLSCTAASPAVCTWAAGGSGSSAESGITAPTASNTITETAAGDWTSRAGVETANLTAPWSQINTNSTNNNTSLGLLVGAAGTSTGGIGLLVFDVSGTGDIARFYSGGSVTSNAYTVGTLEAHITATGALGLGTATCTTFGTGGGLCPAEGTAPTNVSGSDAIYADSTSHELLAATNGSTSFGLLNRSMPGAVNLTGQTASIGTATLCAASAGACNVAGQYKLNFNFWGTGTACSAVTAGSVALTVTWTDENGTAHTAVPFPLWDQSKAALGTSFFFNTALGTESAAGNMVVSTNGTVIQYATTYTACTTGTGSYAIRGTVQRMQ